MATKKANKRKPKASKPLPEEVARTILKHHRSMAHQMQQVLQKAGLKGAKLHGIQISLPHASFAGPGCSPACNENERCVADSNGGTVRWTCVPA